MLIYVVGVHGSGKTTLIDSLVNCYTDQFMKAKKLDIPKGEKIFERQLLRYCRSYTQTFYEQQLAKKEKHVLCDRSYLDNSMYDAAFVQLEWMTAKEHRQIESVKKILFDQKLKNVIFVNPSLDYLQFHLKERWTKEKVKWHESNFEYLAHVQYQYRNQIRREAENILNIEEENLEKRVQSVVEWVNESSQDNVKRTEYKISHQAFDIVDTERALKT